MSPNEGGSESEASPEDQGWQCQEQRTKVATSARGQSITAKAWNSAGPFSVSSSLALVQIGLEVIGNHPAWRPGTPAQGQAAAEQVL